MALSRSHSQYQINRHKLNKLQLRASKSAEASHSFRLLIPLLTTVFGERHVLGHPSVRCSLTFISRYAIYLYSVWTDFNETRQKGEMFLIFYVKTIMIKFKLT